MSFRRQKRCLGPSGPRGKVLELLAQTDCRQLHLFGNRLAALPADLARAAPDLEFLDVSSNDLRDPAARPAPGNPLRLGATTEGVDQA